MISTRLKTFQHNSSSRPSTSRLPATRPTTAHSRPGTARPTTAASTRYEGNHVIALVESRGVAREVGMAALDKDTGRVMLVQLADCQTYVKTLHQMHLHYPSLILVPDTFLQQGNMGSAMLVEYIREEFPGTPVESVGRRYWNDMNGLEFIQQLCVEDDERAGTILAVSNKYYTLSATSALFKYSELRLNIRFAPASLRMRYVPVDGTMLIDLETAKNLELVASMSGAKHRGSLYSTLNHTYTAMAGRLLRVNILSPITIQEAIDARLDVVEEFVQTEETFTDIRNALKTLNKMDFDKIIVSLALTEHAMATSSQVAHARVSTMLSLRSIVRGLPQLHRALEGCRAKLLTIVYEMLSDTRLSKIAELIDSSLNEDAGGAGTKNGIGAMNAKVYAVKANYNRLLDVARETYKENVSDIYTLNSTIVEIHGLPIALQYQESGFVFTLRKTDLEGQLPKGFINIGMKKGRWTFSSLDLKKMNARMKDALDETLLLSEKIIQELVSKIIGDVGALYKASEAVALLDMLWSFSHAAIMHNYVRPEFTGTLAVKGGRHPILDTIGPAGSIIPNDVYVDDSSSFQIVQGPNMSGKSTYLRQIALMCVMALCGSFVPAEYASFRIHDALLTRLSNDDDLERNLSTFASEMATSAMILGLASPMSLILVDELGRGTSPREGAGIAFAIAENLIEKKAFVFFSTHFPELTTLLSRQPSVVNLHLSVQKTRRSQSNFGMMFHYKIIDGAPESSSHYGLELARLADLPTDVLEEGHRVATRLSELHAQDEGRSEGTKIAIRRKALLRLRTQLIQAYEHSALPDQDLLQYIGHFQTDIMKAFLYPGSDS